MVRCKCVLPRLPCLLAFLRESWHCMLFCSINTVSTDDTERPFSAHPILFFVPLFIPFSSLSPSFFFVFFRFLPRPPFSPFWNPASETGERQPFCSFCLRKFQLLCRRYWRRYKPRVLLSATISSWSCSRLLYVPSVSIFSRLITLSFHGNPVISYLQSGPEKHCTKFSAPLFRNR